MKQERYSGSLRSQNIKEIHHRGNQLALCRPQAKTNVLKLPFHQGALLSHPWALAPWKSVILILLLGAEHTSV